jgi:methionyl-tRNA synthetase
MKEIPFGQDGDFSELRFQETVNAALANDLGNLINRCLNLLKKNCGLQLPVGASAVDTQHPMRATVDDTVPLVLAAYEHLALHEAINASLSISRRFAMGAASVPCPRLALVCYGYTCQDLC